MSSTMRRTSRSVASAFAGALLLASLVAVGFASSLPVAAADLFAQKLEKPALTVTVADDFAGNGNLNNRVPPTGPQGSAWSVDASRFRTRFGTAQSRQNPTSRATIDIDASDDFVVTTEVERLGASDFAGLVFLASGTTYLHASYNELIDRVELRTSAGGAALATSGLIGNPTDYTIAVAVDQPDIYVSLDGTTVITYTMTAAEIATFGSQTRSGLIAESRNTRFEHFSAATP